MGYGVHIERRSPSGQRLNIRLSDWREAVQRTAGVRLATGDCEIINPETGETIRIHNPGGDAEMFFSATASWRRVFHWSSGRVSFTASHDFEELGSEIRRLSAELARALGAKLVGDEGEIYD